MHNGDDNRNSTVRHFNRRRPTLNQVLDNRAAERRQTLRSAATYGPLQVWPGTPLKVVVDIYQPGVVVVTLSGEVIDATSSLIGRAVAEQLSGAPQRFIVDMRYVSVLAAAAVGELVAAQLRGQTHNFDVALVAPSDAALHALKVSGIAQHFAIHSTIEGALPD
jgi:anti-anti-sigma factor